MFKKLLKSKKAQNTAEYALLIALVVAGVIAMQQYAQRALQARVRDAAGYMTTQTGTLGNSVQYEPYYMNSSYDITRQSTESKIQEGNAYLGMNADSDRIRTGSQSATYGTGTQGNGVMPKGL